ncbi:MAG: signal peptidase II [Alphaproteobacteria bacterium]|nr:signal peptidase II [Alphaproteobacteria bacterium]MBU1512540.1 signal peptidase II [Alphaproteobacteria bacterium]MBU2092879.1 signal peptidase II [Alphaproteobacteria bacterium]MBU2150882.1 signal peptidase II [Alphaproteobacteria bacterium]MBU2307907.1 signal peptidase II [Alphaproteobacteria bacterium]
MTDAVKTAQPASALWAARAYAIAAVVVVLDQLSKYWILSVVRLPERETMEVIWPLQFTRIWNEGVSFGLLQAQHDVVRWGLVVFSIGVATLLAFWARSQTRLLPALGLGLVIGGAVGNAIDRARFGAVVDFIDVQRLGFFPWIFNIADSGITIGVILLLLDSLRPQRPAA